MITHLLFIMNTITLNIVLSAIFVGIVVVCLTLWLANKQLKLSKTLKPGDKVFFGDFEGEILEKINDNKFVVKTTVSGMRLSKRLNKNKSH